MPNLLAESTPTIEERHLKHNVRAESLFSAFNGILLGLILFGSPVVAVKGVNASPLELTILASAFPVGAFLGPIWAFLGKRWGMKKLVLIMMSLASVLQLFVFWVESAVFFTILLAISQLLNSAMRMGQANLYRIVYPVEKRGRVLGRLTFWTYATMVPSMLLTGWLLDVSHTMYQYIYPAAGICGLLGCFCYSRLRVTESKPAVNGKTSFRSGFSNINRVLRQDRLYRLFQIAFFLTGGSYFLSRHIVVLLTDSVFGFSAFQLALCLVVIPQILLAFGSPLWGGILDRIGILRCRMIISVLLAASLASYFFGLVSGLAFLMYLGSVLQGLSNGGGQLTWFLASSSFAPSNEDVPMYNGIHFVLNGIRGLILPSVGSALFLLSGPYSVLAATLFSMGSIPVLWRALKLRDDRFVHLTRHRVETVQDTKPVEVVCGGRKVPEQVVT